ncbi:s-protein like protein 1 [Quercus suber]|uniref:S-protein like protein 1 n=1 Tax=Quercus suber TaxID=58331 RepID=A0AAW0KPN9_QUESU
MIQMVIAELYCLVLILPLASGQSTSFKLTNNIKIYVRIINHLNNKHLTNHCKSADATLKTTDFYCYFFNENFHATFDVYTEDSELKFNCGGNHCIWTIQKDGFYLYNMGSNQNVKTHDWSE